MMRVGLYRPVHVKTLRSQKQRMLLTHRKLLQSKAIALENDLCGTLRNFGDWRRCRLSPKRRSIIKFALWAIAWPTGAPRGGSRPTSPSYRSC
jgi:transposase